MFGAMDLTLRRQFHDMMDKMALTHQLDNIVFSSFTLHHGCRHRFQAIDFVYAMMALFNPTVSQPAISTMIINLIYTVFIKSW